MTDPRRVLLLSSSKVHGSDFLHYVAEEVRTFLKKSNVENLLFIPYALKTHDDYTNIVKTAFKNLNMNIKVEGIHEGGDDAVSKVKKAEAIFIGGGNTFLLLKTLYENNLVPALRERVLRDGVPYMGSSAGTNVATVSIHTTNDMPIVLPPTLAALNFVPFNINPHYLDQDPQSQHMGESRAERIKQYHELEGSPPVLGLREGSFLLVEDGKLVLKGSRPAILFTSNEECKEYAVGSDLSFLL